MRKSEEFFKKQKATPKQNFERVEKWFRENPGKIPNASRKNEEQYFVYKFLDKRRNGTKKYLEECKKLCPGFFEKEKE